jgi:exodeoxyribonuclease VII large subunit
MFETAPGGGAERIWGVGALCLAVGDTLAARFNPVAVRGEISGFSRAASGHCYFSIKDAGGQIRCAMFRRAAGLLGFTPRDGDSVELRGRLGVYEQRGDLQLVVEHLQRAGQGALFEQFLRLKERLEAEGLFDPARKRALPVAPRGIGLVTSPGAAALHDVVTALRRRVPHIPVLLVPAPVQGAQAPEALVRALLQLYTLTQAPTEGAPAIDVIVLVRGGGSLEDLWAFNDETLARTVVQSPVPLICGVGHETDFSIADFCADLRAATPTAAAELVCAPRQTWLDALQRLELRLGDAVQRQLDECHLRLDQAGARLARPSLLAQREGMRLSAMAARLRQAMLSTSERKSQAYKALESDFLQKIQSALDARRQRLDRAALRLQLLDPALVLQRGYALLQTPAGELVRSVHQAPPATPLRARLADGEIDLTVVPPRLL